MGVVAKSVVKRKEGMLYYVTKNGDVVEKKLARGGKKGRRVCRLSGPKKSRKAKKAATWSERTVKRARKVKKSGKRSKAMTGSYKGLVKKYGVTKAAKLWASKGKKAGKVGRCRSGRCG
jgi:hypothetical protein